MSDDAPEAKGPRDGCPYCGEPLAVGFGDLLPTKRRSGPVRFQCPSCRGWARLATASQVMAVVGFILGLAGGAIAAARVAADSEQSMVIVLALSVAGAFGLSFVGGWAFLRLEPDGAPPSRAAQRERAKRARRRGK